MDSQENALSAEQGMVIIQQMVAKSQQRLAHYSFAYILWGLLIPLISFGHYALAAGHFQYNYAVWFLTIPAGIYTYVYFLRKGRKAPAETPLDKIHGQFWLGYVATIVMLYVALVFSANYFFITPMILIVLGFNTFASSRLLRYKPLTIGAFCLVIAAGTCFFLPVAQQLLILGSAVLLGFFVPGLMLRASKAQVNG